MKAAPIDYAIVREMLRTATPDRLLRFIGKTHPADLAPLFTELDPVGVRNLFEILFSARRADPDDAVTFIDSLPEARREVVLSLLDPKRRAEVREIIGYPEGTVGRIMNTDFMALPPGITAQGAIDKIRERGELETFFYLYVVDDNNKLVGVVPIRNLVIAPRDRKLSEMMVPEPMQANVFMDQEEAARLVAKYELLASPIVDEGGHLEGIITVDDVIDIIENGGAGGRGPRLHPGGALRANALAVDHRELIDGDSGGLRRRFVRGHALQRHRPRHFHARSRRGRRQWRNATATVIIRAIALGELEFSSAWKAIVKPVSVNICLAMAAGAVIAFAALLWKGSPFLGLVLACAMIVNLGLVAGLSGAVIPLLLKALKFDPALGSGIVVTGLTDAFGFLSFLGLATIFIRYLV